MSGEIESGMVVCVENLCGEVGTQSVKLETQILITKAVIERLGSFPWEEV